ncbi:low-affinity phosphate transporter [Apophysomyces ossiformis]|uniref:Low-affinity phosphate transporter n=1 Tax=Apophysomyces ossiformis TaxID=679940 RepID=A0A8H7EU44_9FUNG|nr:low-affinity phosphate transporter [Apophysomyces ossiformis]
MIFDLETFGVQGSGKELIPDRIISTFTRQLNKVSDFYSLKEAEIESNFDKLNSIVEKTNVHNTTSSRRSLCTLASRDSDLQVVDHQSVELQWQLLDLCASVYQLLSYVEVNRWAFDDLIKRMDSFSNDSIRGLQKALDKLHPFLPQTNHALQEKAEWLETIFADLFCDHNVTIARQRIKALLPFQHDRNCSSHRISEIEKNHKVDSGRLFPTFKRRHVWKFCLFLSSVAVFVVLLSVDLWGDPCENRCFALLIFTSILWATEAIPLYATSMLIPFLIVLLDILRYPDGQRMDSPSAAKAVFESMFTGTILMLLGGFALATALSKYGIAKAFASHMLSGAGSRPRWTLLTVMFISSFLSMWISNVATPVLCFSLVEAPLHTLSEDSSLAPCLILGIALASCIGGMTSPISSPQNIVTMHYMDPKPGWGKWFAAALPIAILSICACWFLLLLVYKPDRETLKIPKTAGTYSMPSPSQVCVALVTLCTISLWCAEEAMKDTVGDMGVIAMVPLFVFFGLGILDKHDIHSFLWTVIILAQGGLALGNAVDSSGLLQDIALRIARGLAHLEPMAILVIFTSLILVLSTFVSHTVAALIIIPIVREIGANLPSPHPNLFVMGAGLACSAGMGLPVSGYPNMSAIMLQRPNGKAYLTIKDFFIAGIPTSLFCACLIFTLGYGILHSVGY